MQFKEWLYDPPKVDIRQDYDEVAEVTGGVLYRKGKMIQAWWTHDGRGEPFEQSVAETWTAPDEEQAMVNFRRMQED